MAETVKDLLDGNANWAEGITSHTPDFFEELSTGQTPPFLWIGCADSRVPATQITNTMPGSIFVQRNIANMVVPTDLNLQSVVYYAVKVLKVKHIVVCGHYGCGGVQAAMGNNKFGFLDNWLVHIKNVYRLHQAELDAIADEQEKFNRYVELNVVEQTRNLAKVSFIQEEWADGEFPYIHGLVYRLKDGRLKDLNVTINSNQSLDAVYRYSSR